MDSVIIQTQNGYRVLNEARGHEWYADALAASGGEDSAATPEEYLLGALGSCMAITARMYVNRKGWLLDGIDIKLEMERIDPADYPGCTGESKFAHRIREYITLRGELDHEQRERILEIMKKCPVRKVLENPVVFEGIFMEPV